MYAVIESGGKQYRVEPGDVIDIERVEATGKKVRKVKFDQVLLVGDEKGVQVGTPGVKGAAVSAVLVDDVRGPKVRVFKMKRRKGYRKSQGHRQDLMRVRIDDIKAGTSKGAAQGQTEPTETEAES
ncbi:MAG: 50S ribosomal protein L21 [Acidobacteriota bacterium]